MGIGYVTELIGAEYGPSLHKLLISLAAAQLRLRGACEVLRLAADIRNPLDSRCHFFRTEECFSRCRTRSRRARIVDTFETHAFRWITPERESREGGTERKPRNART